MELKKRGRVTPVVLTEGDVRLPLRVLERPLFIDTPVEEQARIAGFASRAQEQLAQS